MAIHRAMTQPPLARHAAVVVAGAIAIGESSIVDTPLSVVHPRVTASWVPFGYRTVLQPTCSRRNAMSSLRPSSAVSQMTGASAAFDDRDQQLGIDLAGAEVGVPVGARAGGVA